MIKFRILPIVALTLTLAACATGSRNAVPTGTSEPDKFLFDKGTENLNKKKWLTAREFFKQVTETYTQSPYRPDAKLGIGDTYMGERSAEAYVLAINEFREFLNFYPTNKRAHYAQFKLAMAHFNQMKAAMRDQTETREPPPILYTRPGTPWIPAAMVALTASCTNVKSRVCSPSPNSVIGSPRIVARRIRWKPMSGRGRGPYRVK